MTPLLLYVLSGFFVALGLSFWLPPVSSTRVRRLRITFGLDQTQAEAQALGIRLKAKHFALLITISLGAGVVIANLTKNALFVAFGVGLGFIVPKIILSQIRYRRRKEVLLNLPGNCRLFTSKLRDCKSVQKALEMSLPVMNGVTAPFFEKAYQSLRLGVDLPTVLERLKAEVSFKQFDDFCEKILMGSRDGFHARVIEGIRETIDDIYEDMQLLQEMDIKNQRKRLEVYVIFGFCFTFPYLFRYMESQMAQEMGQAITLDSWIGKILIVSMAIVALVGLWKKDAYLRLNLDDL
ncbi:hypothetical protein J1TS5_10160 [Paenibacillus macerans]|uniref:type II secretion system F family protein n=1 Tax=Paenibacillus macerans TaxID=44252 RepID=UPI001B107EF1|nr:hypothetical protein [Paenibacillus macerans]GIP08846.1 hypothetical protein J1TS5_10160 [Paenibacillus macerans]